MTALEWVLAFLLCSSIGWGLFSLFTVRKIKASYPMDSNEVRIVTDLDRMISEPVGFRWNGKVHLIKPMSSEQFFRVINALGLMQAAYKKHDLKEDEVTIAYAKLFSTVCSTITIKDVRKMSHAQIAALFRYIQECVTGKAQVEDTEKKTLKMA